MEEIDNRGVSDALSITFMVILTIFSGVLLQTVQSDAIESALRRQVLLKAQYTYHILTNAMIENSGRSYLRALAEGLRENTVEDLAGLRELLDRIRPGEFSIELCVRVENRDSIILRVPENSNMKGDKFSFSGWFTMIIASENIEEDIHVEHLEVEVSLFRTS